jgi:hypothetical protein
VRRPGRRGTQIHSGWTVSSPPASPVLTVEQGSNNITETSSSATGRCSTPRNNQQLAFLEPHVPLAELHAEPSSSDKEKLIFGIVPVPREFALEFHQFYMLPVEFRDDLRFPMILDQR